MLSYTRLSATVLITSVYFAIFTAVLLSDVLPEVPADTLGFDVDGAWAILHEIASQPHPYNSHANDVVRDYILTWLKNATQAASHVEIVDDLASNGTWADYSIIEQVVLGTSFEGNNILVKIEGTDPAFSSKGGVLFSAHFDSVSTAPGVTDNAMAIVTVMELVNLLTVTRTKRTAIFNINNGEEDGLKGAQAFMQHPWSSIPDTFLNLEGAGAGGHPTLFRATSKAPVLSFANPDVLHPHGTVLSADAFARKVVRSRTDYSVYELGQDGRSRGMEGLDFAYYQGRSKYHTKYDSIPGTKGGKRSLWSMMESTRAVGFALLNQDETHVGPSEQPVSAVYFDLLGRLFFVMTQETVFLFNTALLVLAPAVVLFLRQQPSNSIPDHQPRTKVATNFWAAFVVGLVSQVALAWSFFKLNAFIVYSRPFIVLTSHLTLAYLSIVFTLQIHAASRSELLVKEEKASSLLQLYTFTWVLHALGTYGLKKLELGGVYFLTAWNFFTFLGSIAALLEISFREKPGALQAPGVASAAERADIVGEAQSSSSSPENESLLTNERTPLLSQPTPSAVRLSSGSEDGQDQGWWIIQVLFVIPGPVILLSEILLLLIHSLHQTLSDGSNPIVVYGAISLLSFFIVLPIAPFSAKFHHWLTSVFFLIFIMSTLYAWLAFPFSKEEPLKVFFQQKVEIDLASAVSSTSANKVLKSTTSLVGATGFVREMVVPALPSSWDSEIHCIPALGTLSACSWESSLLPSPYRKDPDAPQQIHWLSVNATRTSASSAFFSIKGANTRSCRIYFDNRPIKSFKVYEVLPDGTKVLPGDNMRKAFAIPEEGVDVVTLWSRTWDRTFDVEVYWDDPLLAGGASSDEAGEVVPTGLVGRVACEWAEYESGTLGVRGLQRNMTGSIPAYEEVLTFLPEWAVATKISDGLVEVFGRFELA